MIVNVGLRRFTGSLIASLRKIFASVSDGYLYDISNISSLFQDSAGTTPVTAVTQPVGLVLDKSGKANNALQATAAARPTWEVDAGGKNYLKFLGTDDSLTSATGGGGSTGFFWCGAVEPSGGAGAERVLWDDESTAATFLGYTVSINAANKLTIYAGNGASYTTKSSTATVNVGTKYLLTAWDDGTNLNVQINSAAAETVGRPVVVAGTAGFTIGRHNTNASLYFIGKYYPSIYVKNSGLTATQRATIQSYVRQKAGL